LGEWGILVLRRIAMCTLVAAVGLAVVQQSTASPGATAKSGSSDEGAPTVSRVVQGKPNVVMILVDDMRADDLRYMVNTRRLIGGEGVTFANSFSPYPWCCPARASILSGQYTHNHRVFSIYPPYAFPAFDDSSTLATALQDAGYSTIMLGKYLNGYGGLPRPGADTGHSVHYVPPGWTDWRASLDGGLPAHHPKFGRTYQYFNTTLSNQGVGFSNYRGRYQTHVYGELSASIIRKRAASDKPFFLFASYTAPHDGRPQEPDDIRWVKRRDGAMAEFPSPARPDGVKDVFDRVIREAPGAEWTDPDITDKPKYLRSLLPTNRAERRALLEVTRQRAEALLVVDRQVKRTVDALGASGELGRTLLIFTSDNGYFLGEQRIRQGKILPHEPSLRTPLLMRGPGLPAGDVRYDPFMSIDFAPTIAALAGAGLGVPADGRSMLRVARRGDLGWRRAVLTETGSRKVVRNTDESGLPLDAVDAGEPDMRWAIGIRTDRYLYVDLASGEEELYDLATDPHQYQNLATSTAGHSELLSLMREQLARMRACQAAECRARLPDELATAPGQSIVD
jgi:arylsulfatase A-like enzyme